MGNLNFTLSIRRSRGRSSTRSGSRIGTRAGKNYFFFKKNVMGKQVASKKGFFKIKN